MVWSVRLWSGHSSIGRKRGGNGGSHGEREVQFRSRWFARACQCLASLEHHLNGVFMVKVIFDVGDCLPDAE